MKYLFPYLVSLFGILQLQDVFAQSTASQDQPAVTLNHIAVYVHDLEKSTTFYEDVLQLKKIPEPFHDGRHTWFSIGGNSQLHLIQGADKITEHNKNSHLCFSVESVDDFIATLDKFNIDRINWAGDSKEPTVRVDGVKQIYFQDPDGYWIEVNDDVPGWVYLFDGTSAASLRGYKMDDFPSDAWKIEDGALVARTDVPNIDLVTKETYQNFELTFDWKVSEGGNSGVFFHVEEVADQESGNGNSPNWLNNFEMQILDDINFDDQEPKRSAGALYDLIAPKNKHLNPVSDYNQARLLVSDGHVEHWLNGNKIVEYEIGSDKLNKLISDSKFRENPEFARSARGHIMFQHHGQKIWLKNIKVRRL